MSDLTLHGRWKIRVVNLSYIVPLECHYYYLRYSHFTYISVCGHASIKEKWPLRSPKSSLTYLGKKKKQFPALITKEKLTLLLVVPWSLACDEEVTSHVIQCDVKQLMGSTNQHFLCVEFFLTFFIRCFEKMNVYSIESRVRCIYAISTNLIESRKSHFPFTFKGLEFYLAHHSMWKEKVIKLYKKILICGIDDQKLYVWICIEKHACAPFMAFSGVIYYLELHNAITS
jgi:hypothetical protein